MTYRFRRALPRLILVSLLASAGLFSRAHAASIFAITEIMYDPAGSDSNREWIEVYNGGTTSLDLAGHVLLTDGLSSTRHALVAQGSSMIPAGGYAVIVQDPAAFKTDYPSYSGILIDSSWSGLTSSAGKTIAVEDSSGSVLDQVTYDPTIGGTNDGNSLQKKASGTWTAAVPTPGAALDEGTVATGTSGTTDGQSGQSEGGLPATSTAQADMPKKTPSYDHIRAELAMSAQAVTGMAVPVSWRVYGYSGELRTYGVFHIAFGDGTDAETTFGKTVEHTYRYAGTYAVSLEYFENPYAHVPDAVVHATVLVSDPSVAVTRMGADGTITLANSGTADFDLSGWNITAPSGTFHIPSGTTLLAGATMLLPVAVTGLRIGSGDSVMLAYPSGQVWMTYAREVASEAQPAAGAMAVAVHASGHSAPAAQPIPAPNKTQEQPPVKTAPVPQKKPHAFWPYILVLVGIIGLGIFLFKKYAVEE